MFRRNCFIVKLAFNSSHEFSLNEVTNNVQLRHPRCLGLNLSDSEFVVSPSIDQTEAALSHSLVSAGLGPTTKWNVEVKFLVAVIFLREKGESLFIFTHRPTTESLSLESTNAKIFIIVKATKKQKKTKQQKNHPQRQGRQTILLLYIRNEPRIVCIITSTATHPTTTLETMIHKNSSKKNDVSTNKTFFLSSTPFHQRFHHENERNKKQDTCTTGD